MRILVLLVTLSLPVPASAARVPQLTEVPPPASSGRWGADVGWASADAIVVGAPTLGNAQTRGRIYAVPLGGTPSYVLGGDPARADRSYGWSITAGFDFNGDGLPDVAGTSRATARSGSVGLDGAIGLDEPGGVQLQLIGAAPFDAALPIEAITDLDGDERDELVVGSRRDVRRVDLVLGTDGAGPYAPVTRLLPDDEQDDGFGEALADVGDIDGDGVPDLAVSAPRYAPNGGSSQGAVYLFRGRDQAPWLGEPSRPGEASSSCLLIGPEAAPTSFGASVSAAGDLDGDGIADLAVGAPEFDPGAAPGAGAVYVYFGAAGGCPERMQRVELPAEDVRPGDAFGTSIGGGGDLDGDGLHDLAVGAQGAGEDGRGLLAVFFGPFENGDYDEVVTVPAPAGPLATPLFTRSLALGGEVVGLPGVARLAMGAPGDGGSPDGQVWVAEFACGPAERVMRYDDADGDGYGVGEPTVRCPGYRGGADLAGDCDDDDPARTPGAAELCDGVDNDCDDVVPTDEADDDGDGVAACEDCDDADPERTPGAAEACDGVDNDCDGVVPTDEADDDGDGAAACEDCDDAEPAAVPGGVEVCDGIDNDCEDGVPADEVDEDGDGAFACGADCDDGDPAVPTAEVAEVDGVCDDGVDNDCDGETDDPLDCIPEGCACESARGGDGPWVLLILLVALRRRGGLSRSRPPRSPMGP